MTLKIKAKGRGEAKVQVNQGNLSLLDWAETGGVTLPYGCRAGSCGSCRVVVKTGMEHLEECTPTEVDTLRRCQDPADVRLACRAQVRESCVGEIELEVAPPVKDPIL